MGRFKAKQSRGNCSGQSRQDSDTPALPRSTFAEQDDRKPASVGEAGTAAPRPDPPSHTPPSVAALGVRGPLPAAERPLPLQAFVHEAHIPAAAVAVLIFYFCLYRRLHGTGDRKRGLNWRPALGPRSWNTPPRSAVVQPWCGGRGEDAPSNRRPALSRPDGAAKLEASSPRRASLPFTASVEWLLGLAVERNFFPSPEC